MTGENYKFYLNQKENGASLKFTYDLIFVQN